MGADMKVSYVHFPVGHDLEKEREALLLFSKSMTQEMMEDIMREHADFPYEILVDPVEIIVRGFKALKSRRTTYFTFKGSVIYLSGGLSWGDSPTEEMDAIEKLSYLMEIAREKSPEHK